MKTINKSLKAQPLEFSSFLRQDYENAVENGSLDRASASQNPSLLPPKTQVMLAFRRGGLADQIAGGFGNLKSVHAIKKENGGFHFELKLIKDLSQLRTEFTNSARREAQTQKQKDIQLLTAARQNLFVAGVVIALADIEAEKAAEEAKRVAKQADFLRRASYTLRKPLAELQKLSKDDVHKLLKEAKSKKTTPAAKDPSSGE